jgi:hypothetical protein
MFKVVEQKKGKITRKKKIRKKKKQKKKLVHRTFLHPLICTDLAVLCRDGISGIADWAKILFFSRLPIPSQQS